MGEQTKNGRTDLRVVKTRDAIRSAFERLLETTGYSDITVSAIAREARVSRKTFYAHFSSVNDLLELMAKEVVDQIAGEIQPEGELLDVDDWVAQFTRTTMAELRDNPHWGSNVVRFMPPGSLAEMIRGPLESLCEQELRKRGLAAAEGHEYVMSFFVGGLCTTYETWLIHGSESVELDDAANLIALAATQGVGGLLVPAQ